MRAFVLLSLVALVAAAYPKCPAGQTLTNTATKMFEKPEVRCVPINRKVSARAPPLVVPAGDTLVDVAWTNWEASGRTGENSPFAPVSKGGILHFVQTFKVPAGVTNPLLVGFQVPFAPLKPSEVVKFTVGVYPWSQDAGGVFGFVNGKASGSDLLGDATVYSTSGDAYTTFTWPNAGVPDVNVPLAAGTVYALILTADETSAPNGGKMGAPVGLSVYPDGAFWNSNDVITNAFQPSGYDTAFTLLFESKVDCVGSWVANGDCVENACNAPAGTLPEIFTITTQPSAHGAACAFADGTTRQTTVCSQPLYCIDCVPVTTDSACQLVSGSTCPAQITHTTVDNGAGYRVTSVPTGPTAIPCSPPVGQTFDSCPCTDCVGSFDTCVALACGSLAGSQTFHITTAAVGPGQACAFAEGATQSCTAASTTVCPIIPTE